MDAVASISSVLYGGITGEAISSLKRAQKTARLIEEDLIAQGWPVGMHYGSEQEIAARYRIGRCAAREAIRILQLRGAVRMQRGPGGGMVVAAPQTEDVVRAMSDYLMVAGISREAFIEARRTVNIVAAMFAASTHSADVNDLDIPAQAQATFRLQVAELSGNELLRLLVRCIEQLDARLNSFDSARAAGNETAQARAWEARTLAAIKKGDAVAAAHAMEMGLRSSESRHDERNGGLIVSDSSTDSDESVPHYQNGSRATRAEQVAATLALEIKHNAVDGQRLGSEFQLCERYGVSRSVMRQAIRILEDGGIVHSQRGRGHGLIARQPRPGPTIRLMCGYLVQRALTIEKGWTVARQLHIELAKLAAAKVTDEDRIRLRQLMTQLESWNGPFEHLPMVDSECEIVSIARNPILDLFTCSMKAFGSWVGGDGARGFPSASVDHYRELAKAVLEAICCGDISRAGEAEFAKHDFLLRNVWLPAASKAAQSAVDGSSLEEQWRARVCDDWHERIHRVAEPQIAG